MCSTTTIRSGCSAAAPCGWAACFPGGSTTRGAPHGAAHGLEDHVQLSSAVTLVPGLRWDWSGLNGRASLSPRLSGVVALNAATRLTGAAGLYTQSPGYEKLLQADHFTDLTASGRLDLRPERATHAIVGLDRDIAPGVLGRVEGYYKRFTDLIVGRLETEDQRLARLARYDFPASLQSTLPVAALITSVPTNDSSGQAYGLDFFLSRADGPAHPRLTGWISYSLAKTEQNIYGRSVPFSYDRPHSLSVVWNWRASSRWELAGTARAASGFPWTPPAGVRVATREIGFQAGAGVVGAESRRARGRTRRRRRVELRADADVRAPRSAVRLSSTRRERTMGVVCGGPECAWPQQRLVHGCEHGGPDLVVVAAEGRTDRRFSPPADGRPALQVPLVRPGFLA
jgi:hypothetical protein